MADINDLIAGGIKPPQVDDMTTASAKQATLGSLMQRQQLGAQELASGKIALEQQRNDAADLKAINDSVAQNTTIGPDGQPKLNQEGVVGGLAASGNGRASMKAQAQFTASADAKAKLAATNLDTTIKQGTLTKQRADRAAELFGAVETAPPEGKQQAYDTAHQTAMREGVISPQDQAQFPALYDPSLDPHIHSIVIGAQDASTKAKLALDASMTTDNADKHTKTLADQAETWRIQSATQASNALNQQDLDGIRTRLAQSGAPPAALAQIPARWSPEAMKTLGRSALTAEQRTTADAAEATRQETASRDRATQANEAAQRTQGQQRLGIEGAQLKINQERYGFDTNGVSPAAQMAADGRMDPATLRSMLRSNPGLIGQIQRVDPNFDEGNMDNRFTALKEFGSTSISKAGGQALALNTLIHHADLYMQTAEALKNGSFRPGNAVYNAVANAFGAAPPTNAALVARFFASETGKVATGGVPAEGEINGILKNLGTDAGPDQIAGAGKTLLQIAAGRATPLIERAKEARIDNIVHVIGPDAQEILKRRGFDPNTMKPASGAQHAVGDIVMVGNKKVKISVIHQDGTFDGGEVK
jgi:hypothetical protein